MTSSTGILLTDAELYASALVLSWGEMIAFATDCVSRVRAVSQPAESRGRQGSAQKRDKSSLQSCAAIVVSCGESVHGGVNVATVSGEAAMG